MRNPDGPADTAGARYEHWWTLAECVRLLHGASETLRIETLAAGRAELTVTTDVEREVHYARLRHPAGTLSLTALDSAGGPLQTAGDRLAGNDDRFVLVSAGAAPELSGPCAAAAASASAEAFERGWLTSRARREWFARLLRCWVCEAPAAVDRLRRMEVRTVGEREVEMQARRGLQTLFAVGPGTMAARLLAIVEGAGQRTLTRREIVERLARRGFRPRRLHDPGRAGAAVARATDRYLDGARRRLIRGAVLPREAAARLKARLEGTASESVLTGRAGAGKTACVVDVVDAARARGLPVLAFRLDHAVTAATAADLGRHLDLEESPVLVLAEAARAAGRAGVLIVDEVDTSADPSGDGAAAGRLVERVLQEARGIRPRAPIHTAVVCRAFDWRNDPGLRRLLPAAEARIDVAELDRREVEETLAGAGLDPGAFGDREIEILRLPQHLHLLLDSGADASSAPAFATATALFDRYWTARRREVAARAAPQPDQWLTVVRTLCAEMVSTRQRTVPVERLDEVSPAYLEHLAAAGVVVLDGRRCGFGHESLLDYCAARVFFHRRESLVSSLEDSSQHLSHRTRIRQTLAYLRDADPAQYARELRGLLAGERIRPHVKDLAFATLADVPDPTGREWTIWERWIAPALKAIADDAANPDPLSALAWRRFFDSASWFAFTDRHGPTGGWLAADNDRVAGAAVGYLRRHHRHAPDRVAALLEPYADLGGDWTPRLRAFMERADHHASRRLFELFLRLVDNGALDEARGRTAANATFWSMVRGLGEQRPEWVPEVVAHRFRRRLAVLQATGQDLGSPGLPGYDDHAAELFARAAEHAPGAFVEHVLDPVLDFSDATLTGDSPPRHDAAWPIVARTEYPEADHACLDGLAAALAAVARAGEKALADTVADLRRRETHVANRLLLALYAGSGARRADEAVTLLCDESWRFQCGFYDSPQRYATETIRAVVAHCATESRERLERALLGYVAPDERGLRGYRQAGRARLALLSALPAELRSAGANAAVQALERKFGKDGDSRRTISVDSVEPPIDRRAAETMSDEQWLGAIARHRPRAPAPASRDELKGSAWELAGHLEARAAEDPDRFARLALKLPPNAHPVYLDRVLAALRTAATPPAIKLQLCQKAFADSRGACGRSIADALGSIREPLPNDAVRMLHWLATEHEDPATTAWQEEEVGIDTARGSAADAIRRLIVEDAAYISRFRVTLDRLIRDPSASVRACAAAAIRAVADRDPTFGMTLFNRLDLSDDRLLASSQVYDFLRDSLRDRFTDVRPVVERMLQSSAAEVCEAGARLASLGALEHAGAVGPSTDAPQPAVAAMSAEPEHRSAADLAADAARGGPAHRLGVAHVAAANLAIPAYRRWSAATLAALFDDDDGGVRRRAASCFRHVQDGPLETYGSLMEAFSASKAFGDDPTSILDTLEASREPLPGAACTVCEKFLDGFADEARDARSDRHADALTVATLAFRLCRQHQDGEWAKRALDLVDRLCLQQIGDARGALDEFER